MTEGQELALEQLEEIERSSDGLLEIVEVIKPQGLVESLRVIITVFCGSYEKAVDGLPLKTRERLTIGVPPEFPFVVPDASTKHPRFAGFPHVQWKTKFCLYQSPSNSCF